MKEEAKKRAQRMRKQGFSMVKIANELDVSKSSVYRWCRNIELTEKQKLKLEKSKLKAMKRARKKAAKQKSKLKEKRIRKNKKKGLKKVGDLSKRDKYIAGLMLYSGEGAKTDGRVEIANTDPKIIIFMLDWFKEFYNKKPDDFRAELYIHDNLEVDKAIDFWQKYTKIPSVNFLDPYIVENNPDRLRGNTHKNGVLKIGLHDCNLHRQIIGSIEAVLQNNIPR